MTDEIDEKIQEMVESDRQAQFDMSKLSPVQIDAKYR